ncbi:Nuclear transport factor 2 [Macleaya cordata]|uniref:Nuclear transport factor 2 n=1 Tax=Macleaya cordata TaxID=56857 RepID=A0A200QY00_MACCD|nr:Nuclear transport factor 2 [Macleaya cordata]
MDNQEMAMKYPDVVQFVQLYYQMCDANPSELAVYYKELSMFSMEGQIIHGKNAIVGALSSMNNFIHTVQHIDIMPLVPDNSMPMIGRKL